MAVERLIFCRKGPSATVTVIEGENAYKELRINDVPEVPTDYGSLQAFHLLGHLPCLFHKNPRKALVLCFGAGITTGALARHDLKQIDAVEICPEVIEANACFAAENHNVLADSRLHLILDEGRNFLRSNNDLYDVLACDSTHPRSGDSWMLYSKEFYESCARRLASGGILCQWLPLHGLKPAEYKRILNTFLAVFPSTTLWFVNRFTLLLATPKRLAIDFARFAQKLKARRIRDDLEPLHLDDPHAFLSCLVTDEKALAGYARGAGIITDNSGLPRRHSRRRLATDTKPLNLSGLSEIRIPPSSLLRHPGKEPSALRSKLEKHFEARGHVIQGRVFCFQGLYEEEKESYRRALKIIPEDREAKHLLGQAEFNRLLGEAKKSLDGADYDGACRIYRKALRLNPTSAAPRYNLGVVYLRTGLYDKALSYFQKALKRVPWNAETHYSLAMTYWKMGRDEDCLRALEEALRFHPGMEKARQALTKLEAVSPSAGLTG